MNKKSYWFYLEPYVHISIKRNNCLLYNTLNGKILEYYNEPEITKVIKRLLLKKSLLVIKLTEEDMNHRPKILRFVKKTKKYFMGDLIDTKFSSGKPIQMMPILNILKDIQKLKKDSSRSIGENIMKYLTEVSFYLNNHCDLKCSICKDAYRQFLCCHKDKQRQIELGISQINDFLEQAGGSNLHQINILGGNILKYSKLKDLINILIGCQVKKVFYLNYLNINFGEEKLDIIKLCRPILQILATFPIDETKLRDTLDLIKQKKIDYQLKFIIQNEEEIEKTNSLISDINIDKVIFQPYFNNRNQTFFDKYVFVKKEQLLKSKPTPKDIYTRTSINPLNFGRIIIFSNGTIYANVNANIIGTLGKNSIYDAIYCEMENGKSWRRTRTKVNPCKNCIFDLLCPPLSNYEFVLERNNLCHIWK